ncbi:MAG TPA: ribosome maturation factor RimP [Candidatus Avidehalobacter gallistercoris]|uniref:Ribosome maturation factor RimP n=1 Tax=Candidatus Avidehalobacter gallistercoris TaxID=2840694 RepID=A0A9D1HK74_9FIRM|nr:ribosome maturation factor RimP [Candidatus Avidehalobacter gallistercoris]
MANEIERRVFALAEPICQANAVELVAVEWQKAGKSWRLALYIDCEGGVGHELCVAVSNAVSDALDALDFIEPAYNLEVSSPGLERPLLKPADFQRFAGSLAAVKLFAARNGQKEFCGELLGYSATEGVLLSDEKTGERLTFDPAEIAGAHLVFRF